MSFLDDIGLLLTAACRVGSAAFLSAVTRTVKHTCLVMGLVGMALALLLGALGLMIAALFIGLTPQLGAHWAAMIAAAAALMGSGVFLSIAFMVSKTRR